MFSLVAVFICHLEENNRLNSKYLFEWLIVAFIGLPTNQPSVHLNLKTNSEIAEVGLSYLDRSKCLNCLNCLVVQLYGNFSMKLKTFKIVFSMIENRSVWIFFKVFNFYLMVCYQYGFDWKLSSKYM